MSEQQSIENKEVLTLEEASQLFQVSTKTFLKLLREENIPARKVGREWRFSKSALLQWMSEGNSRDYSLIEDQNQAYFEQVAPVYDELRKGCYGNALREMLIAKFTPKPGFEVADIGTGTGYLAHTLAQYAKKVWALDSSPAMLEVARKDFLSHNLNNVILIEGDAHDLPLNDNSQDLVYANLLLHHILEPSLAIKEMFRVVKPDGKAIITDIDLHNYKWLKEEKSDLWLGFERAEIKGWLQEAGFTAIEVTDLGCNCRTSSKSGTLVEIPMFLAVGTKPPTIKRNKNNYNKEVNH
ncbi:MAG TPA: methyltransferase domain-containing protein [Bacillota bacterium]|nr:methyltransferase domain-containing protein [Bacillota bacterium]HOL09250.1 methyltransferase domain-containing protein [Bacillota bacterium]HPO96913.1 methyltransferase domain-containing protein [Bacillota bacterium]